MDGMDGFWKTPGKIPPLRDDAVQIWRVELVCAGAASEDSRLLLESSALQLSPEERSQAARMRVGGPLEEFTVGRGCLRLLLGVALSRSPASVVLERGLYGKPFVRVEPGMDAPWFNVAHSHGVVLIGLSTVSEIGVDVEFVDQSIDLEGVAQTAFHPDEVSRVLAASTLEERVGVFYRCWTRKEALAKADGRGLTLEPTTYVAGLDEPGEQRVMLPGSLVGDEFVVRELEVGPLHRAALATRGGTWPVRTYRFPRSFGTVYPE